jgi:hypothetical protein
MLSSEWNGHRAPGKTPRPRTQNHRLSAPRAKGLRIKKKDKVDPLGLTAILELRLLRQCLAMATGSLDLSYTSTLRRASDSESQLKFGRYGIADSPFQE